MLLRYRFWRSYRVPFWDLALNDHKAWRYFLPSPWMHFLAPGCLGQRKKQQPQRERQLDTVEMGVSRQQQLDSPSELKAELIPSALFNTTLFLFSAPPGLYEDTFWRLSNQRRRGLQHVTSIQVFYTENTEYMQHVKILQESLEICWMKDVCVLKQLSLSSW